MEEPDHRVDHLFACDELLVIVIGTFDNHQRFGRGCRVVEPAALFDRDDTVAIACNDEDRASNTGDLVD